MYSEFQNWNNYFKANRSHFDHVDWEKGVLLSGKEKRIISRSLRSFQRGEHSEGKHFLKFAAELNDPVYEDTLRLFIKEEQDHAFVLGKFMTLNKIAVSGKDAVDGIFRWLRKQAGLEGTVTVLLTAEIIAMVYYAALERATSSSLLKQLCRQILEDEKYHLEFQSHTLFVIYRRKKLFSVLISRLLHAVLMSGTLLVVWIFHFRVFRTGTVSFPAFFRKTWRLFSACENRMKGNEAGIMIKN